MKKSLLSLMVAGVVLSPAAMAYTSAQQAKGFTGITGDFTNSNLNPALINKYKANDDIYLTLGLSANISDPDEMIDGLDSTIDIVDEIESKDYSSAMPMSSLSEAEADADRLMSSLEELDDDILGAGTTGTFMIAIPNQYLGLALYAEQNARLATSFDLKDSKKDIEDAIESGGFELEDLNSEVSVTGYSVADVGLVLGTAFGLYGDSEADAGIALKYQRIDLIDYNGSFKEFEDDFEVQDHLTDEAGFNVDLGMNYTLGSSNQYSVSMVTRNLISKKIKSESGKTFELTPTATMGLGYHGSLLNAALEVDLVKQPEFGMLTDQQFAKVGFEFNAWGHAQLRAGYKANMLEMDESVITAGVGISPWDFIALDVSAYGNTDGALGAGLQVGLKI